MIPEVINMKFPEAVFHLRESLGLSQMAFAKELGVSFTSVNRWENEVQKLSPLAIKMIQVFCKERGLSFYYHDMQISKEQQGATH